MTDNQNTIDNENTLNLRVANLYQESGSTDNNNKTLYKGELLIEGPLPNKETYPKLIIGTADNQKVGSASKIDFNAFATKNVCKDSITSKITWDEQKNLSIQENVKISHDEAIENLQEAIMKLQEYIHKIVPSPDGKVEGSTLMIGSNNNTTWGKVVLGPNDDDPQTVNKPAKLFISDKDGLKYNIPSENDLWKVVPVAFYEENK